MAAASTAVTTAATTAEQPRLATPLATPSPPSSLSADTTYTRAHVAQHNEKNNGWLIINNKIYDVSHFYDDHPGGRDVLLACIGRDATDEFEAVHHSKGALRKMQLLCVGSLVETEQRTYITMEQVRAKTSADAAWLVINNKVYDVTDFLDHHPGGRDVLLCHAGGDATDAFVDNGHSDMAYKMMQKYCIGDIEMSERKAHVERRTHSELARAHSKQQQQQQQRGGRTTTTSASRQRSGDASLAQRVATQLKIATCVALFCVLAVYILS